MHRASAAAAHGTEAGIGAPVVALDEIRTVRFLDAAADVGAADHALHTRIAHIVLSPRARS